MITITLNGTPHSLTAGTTLAQCLATAKELAQPYASAINGEFIAREAREQTVLKEGDDILTFQAITGG